MKIQLENIVLGSCYNTGLAYSMGYDANGDIELIGETFTNLDTGWNGGAMAALLKHRQQFDPSRDVEQFIVALKPVKIISGREEDEDYKLEYNAACDVCGIDYRVDGEKLCEDCLADTCSKCGEEWGSVNCLCEDDYDWCPACGELEKDCICPDDCVFDDVCDGCLRSYGNCLCCEDCGELPENCNCCPDCDRLEEDCICKNISDRDNDCVCNELDQEFIVDTFRPMNAFDRARWLKAEGKI